jgi:hypothetical protein
MPPAFTFEFAVNFETGLLWRTFQAVFTLIYEWFYCPASAK